MKFLFVANTLPDPSKGASGCDLSTMHALRQLGHEVDDVWTGQRPRLIPHHNLHQLLELPRVFRSVVTARCRSKRYDVVIVNQPHAWLAARIHRQRHYSGVFLNRSHGWEPTAWKQAEAHEIDSRPRLRRAASAILRALLRRHNRLVLRWADGMVASNSTDARAMNEAGAGNVLALEPGVAELFLDSPARMHADRADRVLYAATHAANKAPAVAAAVMKALAVTNRFRLTWVTEIEAHSKVRALLGDAAPCVDLRSWCSQTEMRELLDTHGIFLQPSLSEGFSLAFLQAMARGCCVIGTRIDCMQAVIESGVHGFLFPPGEYRQMAEKIFHLNASALIPISQEAEKKARTFTWERTAKKLVAFASNLLETKKVGTPP